jgi:hypothetical protein
LGYNPWVYFYLFLAIILTILSGQACANRALFSPQELDRLQQLKSRRSTIQAYIASWHESEKNFFKDVLQNTSREDFASMKAHWPFVNQELEKSDDKNWWEKTLNELSRPKD